MEIFRKAKELAKIVYDENDVGVIRHMPRYSRAGERHLHEQGARIFRMAWETAFKKKLEAGDGVVKDDCMHARDVINEIEELYQKHGKGWKKIEEAISLHDPLTGGEGKICKAYPGDRIVVAVKDFDSPDDIIGTLAFLKKMGVVFERQDTNDFSQAVHLRMTKDDYDMIFNPSREVSNGKMAV